MVIETSFGEYEAIILSRCFLPLLQADFSDWPCNLLLVIQSCLHLATFYLPAKECFPITPPVPLCLLLTTQPPRDKSGDRSWQGKIKRSCGPGVK